MPWSRDHFPGEAVTHFATPLSGPISPPATLLVPNPRRYNAQMNKEWHQRHVMPKNATLDERIAWHREHQKRCACRPIPPKLREQMGAGDVDPRFAPVV